VWIIQLLHGSVAMLVAESVHTSKRTTYTLAVFETILDSRYVNGHHGAYTAISQGTKVVDSGCTSHMSPSSEGMYNIVSISSLSLIYKKQTGKYFRYSAKTTPAPAG